MMKNIVLGLFVLGFLGTACQQTKKKEASLQNSNDKVFPSASAKTTDKKDKSDICCHSNIPPRFGVKKQSAKVKID